MGKEELIVIVDDTPKKLRVAEDAVFGVFGTSVEINPILILSDDQRTEEDLARDLVKLEPSIAILDFDLGCDNISLGGLGVGAKLSKLAPSIVLVLYTTDWSVAERTFKRMTGSEYGASNLKDLERVLTEIRDRDQK